ncbi:MAG: ABC transporter permease [Chloroflexi bacterium]|nr:ABC transporter permease [Chloroflexota bacterium]
MLATISKNLIAVASAWQLVVKRSLAQWRLLSSVFAGVLLATAMMAATAVYFDALRSLALKVDLRGLSPTESNVALSAVRGPTNYQEYGDLARAVNEETNTYTAWFLRSRERAARSAVFLSAKPGTNLDVPTLERGRDRSYFAFYAGIEGHITILPGGRLSGRLAPSPPGEPIAFEAIVPADIATSRGIAVGDELIALPWWDDVTPHAVVRVSGLFARTDPGNDYWAMDERILSASSNVIDVVPFFVSEDTYFDVLGGSFRSMESTYGWLLRTDLNKIGTSNAADAMVSIRLLKNRLGSQLPGYLQFTSLDLALEENIRREFFARLPMVIAMVLMVVVILYYVAVLSAMLAAQRSKEVSVLKSRGATRSQILGVFALEGLTIAVLGALLGPLLAAFAVSLLGLIPPLSHLTENEFLTVNLARNAFTLSAIGGAMSFVALMIPAIRSSRVDVTVERQFRARPSRQPTFQRYYLDVLLLIVGVLLFRQLTEQGSVVATEIFGGVVVDQVLLATPAVVLGGLAMVLLRLLPVLLGIGSRIFSSRLPAGMVLGLWQMARNPTHYARLSLLLILTAGLGIFVSGIGGTLQRNSQERVLYETGAELRVEGITRELAGTTRPFVGSYEQEPGINEVLGAYRGRGFDVATTAVRPFDVLAVDTSKVESLGWFRDDFADEPLDELLQDIRHPSRPAGIRLPGDTKTIEAVVKISRSHRTTVLLARVRDANGRYFTYSMGELDFADDAEWQVLTADPFSRIEGRMEGVSARLLPTQPLDLVSLAISERDTGNLLTAGWLLIDSIRVSTENGQSIEVEGFDSALDWTVLRTAPEAVADQLLHSGRTPGDSPGSILFSWSGGRPLWGRGLHHGTGLSALPLLASPTFMDETGHSLGDEFNVTLGGGHITVRLAGSINYFPSLDTVRKQWIVADLDAMLNFANLDPASSEIIANEVWLSVDEGAVDQVALAESLLKGPFPAEEVFDQVSGLKNASVDPFVDAGWRALLFVAFATMLGLSIVGFSLHAYLSFRDREGQFALLRSLGLSTGQLAALMWLEQAIVVVSGLALGTWMGGRLGAAIVPFIGSDETGRQPLPPFVLEIDWPTLLGAYSAMIAVFAIVIVGVIVVVRRITLQQVLKMGDL